MKTLIACGSLFNAVDGRVQHSQCILVEHDRIACVGSVSDVARAYGAADLAEGTPQHLAARLDATFEDLSHSFVMPGLIEGHAHIGMDPAIPMSTMMLDGGYGRITVRAIRNAQADLLAGFTTVRDESCFAYIDVDVRDLIDEGAVWGPRLKVSGLCLSSPGGHADMTHRPGLIQDVHAESSISYVVNGADEARRAARMVIKHGVDHVKLMASGGVLSDDAHPGAQDLLFDEMRAACEVARAHGKPVSAHAHGAQSIKDALRAGVTSIEHGTLIDREGCELLAETGAYLIPTIIAHGKIVRAAEQGNVPPAQAAKARLVMSGVRQGLSCLRELGVQVGFGTDAGTAGNYHGRQAGEFALMIEEGGFTTEQVLLAATRVNAQMLGMSDLIGSIEAGKQADIAAFDGDPFQDIHAMERCSFVMKAGETYLREGVPTHS